MADETATGETTGADTAPTPPGTEITPSGGILTRTDGSPTPVVRSDWRAGLPAELQGEKSLDVFKGADWAEVGPSLVKGYVNAQKLVGKGYEPPAPDAKPETLAEFRKRAGVPETPAGYGVTMPKAPDGKEWDPGEVSGFLAAMHKAHARPEAAQAGLDFFVRYMARQSDLMRSADAQTRLAERAAAIKALESEWGPENGPLWNHHNARALALIDVLAEDDADTAQRWKELADDPGIARLLSNAAPKFIEAGYMGVAEQPGNVGMEGAQAEADRIRDAWEKDPQHPLGDPTHPEYANAWKHYEHLLARAAGPRGREVVAEVRR